MGLARITTPWRRWVRDEAGASAVEFAILSPVLIVLALGMVDYGLAYGVRLKIERVLTNVQADALRAGQPGDPEELRADLQARFAAMEDPENNDYINGFDMTAGVTVDEGFGCPADAANANPIQDGLAGNDECDCGAETCRPYRYYAIGITASYALPFGLNMNLPFMPSVDFLSSIDLSTRSTVLVPRDPEAEWRWPGG